MCAALSAREILMRRGFGHWRGCFVLALVLWSLAFAGAQANSNLQITSGPKIEHVDSNSVVIAWSTNTNASTLLKYGTDPKALNLTTETPWGGLTHRVTVSNLLPNTTYYFQVVSAQGQGTGTAAMSTVSQFTTAGGPGAASNPGQASVEITSGPDVDYVGSNQAKVSWTTNLPSNSAVKYGTDPNLLNQIAHAPWETTQHQITLATLNPNTTYYFQIESGQARATGTGTESGVHSFQTVKNGQVASTQH